MIHHLERRRYDPAGDDCRDRFAGRADAREVGEQGADRAGQRRQAYGDLRRDPEVALGADKEPDQIWSPGLTTRAAQLDDRAVGEQDLEREDVICRDAVLEAVRAAGILGDVAAHSARRLTRGIGRVLETVRFRRGAEFRVDDAGLDHRAPVGVVDLQNPVEARQHEQHLAGAGEDNEVGNAAMRWQAIHRVREALSARLAHVAPTDNGRKVAG